MRFAIITFSVFAVTLVACAGTTDEASTTSDLSTKEKKGVVRLLEAPPGLTSLRVNAVFGESAGTPPDTCKVIALNAGCKITHCSSDSIARSELSDQAGPLALVVGDRTISVTRDPQSRIYGELVSASQPIMVGGQRILLQAKGGADVPAFDVSLVAPTPTALDLVPDPVTSRCALPTDDRPLTWKGGVAGDTMEIVSVYTSSRGSGDLTCSFPAGDGRGTLPYADVEAAIGAKARPVVIVGQATRSISVQSGAYQIEVKALQQQMGCYLATP